MPEISGSRTLHRLIYSSRQEIAPADVDHEVGNIIRSSIRRNREASITGLLLVHEGWFLQALEGPAEAVMTTYGRIGDDPRHSGARVIHAGPTTTREFADWNMCARRMAPATTRSWKPCRKRRGSNRRSSRAPRRCVCSRRFAASSAAPNCRPWFEANAA